jgi:hypothetical protein
VPILQCLQSRAQIKAQELGDRHGDVGVAVGIDGEERGLEPLIANHALDGGAGLALIEQDRLRIGNPPAIAHMGMPIEAV